MKKKQFILGMCFILLAIITGCRDTSINQGKEVIQEAEVVSKEESFYNKAFEKYAQDGIVALIINEPEEEVIKGLTSLETYTHHKDIGKLLVIPKYNGTKIEVKKVNFDGENIVEGETLYTKSYTGDDYGLLIETVRPEGIPELLVSVSIGERQATYIIAEDGKDGIPALMYLNANEEDKTKQEVEDQEVDEEVQIIYPMEEGDSLQDYTLLNVNKIDMEDDGRIETIEVYCTASLGEDGQLIMDDGNRWKLIVRKDEKLYTIFDSFIQIGRLEYRAYGEYGDPSVFHLLISNVQGAGFTMYDCYYDESQDAFISKKAYQATGNISVYGRGYPE